MQKNSSPVRCTDEASIAAAVTFLRQGKLVAFPTETVYGLGADAENGEAVASVFSAKGRPAHNPLIVHILETRMAERYAEWNDTAARLAENFWPGPLTLVLNRREDCPASALVSPNRATIALRVPAHPVARLLLKGLGRGIAAPSANRSGRVSPTRAEHVEEDFRHGTGGPALILDGGPAEAGIESTVIDCTNVQPAILREGFVSREQIQGIISLSSESASARAESKSPGNLASHYAPSLPLRLNAASPQPGEAFLAFGPVAVTNAPGRLNLSEAGDIKEAAANLYAMLRLLDRPGEYEGIGVMPIPAQGLGAALNDRLRRAAAPKEPQ